jgi:hypothetical protein
MMRNELLKELMLGLIYPAVLGTVLVSSLAAVVDPMITNLLQLGNAQALTDFQPVRWALVIITLSFYLCDYLYIRFTKNFTVGFFLLDIMFLVALYVTFIAIDLDGVVFRLDNLYVIAGCYFLFMCCYLGWDIYERRQSSGDETRLYNRVILWECCSICLLFGWFIKFRRTVEVTKPGWQLALVLGAITIGFIYVIHQKQRYYTHHSTAPSPAPSGGTAILEPLSPSSEVS